MAENSKGGVSSWTITGKDGIMLLLLLAGGGGGYKLITSDLNQHNDSDQKEVATLTAQVSGLDRTLAELKSQLANLQAERIKQLQDALANGAPTRSDITNLGEQIKDLRVQIGAVEYRSQGADADMKQQLQQTNRVLEQTAQQLEQLRNDVNNALRGPLPGPRAR